MDKLRTILGYLVAALGVPLLLATFVGMNVWAPALVSATGVTVSPWFTGDTVARTIHHGDYRTEIHKPVFQALIGERKEGFVQVDWTPTGLLPQQIDEEIDYDGDGQPDFRVVLDPQAVQATLTPLTPAVLGLEGTYRLDTALAIRVQLKNPRR